MILLMVYIALTMSEVTWNDELVSGGGDVVVLADVKKNIQVEITDDDAGVIDLMIKRATEFVENYTNRQLINASRLVVIDAWPDVVELPRSPASAVASIQYYDGAGALQTLESTEYETDFRSSPARIKPGFGKTWPTLRSGKMNAVEIAYTAGFGASASDTPEVIKAACFLLIKDWYDIPGGTVDRERHQVPYGVYPLLDPHRVPVPA